MESCFFVPSKIQSTATPVCLQICPKTIECWLRSTENCLFFEKLRNRIKETG